MPKAKAERSKSALTPKQEAFARAYIETGNASEAYRRSYKCTGWTENALNVQAHRTLNHPKVSLRVRELASEHAQRHEITVDSITKMLADAYALAMKEEVLSPSAAVSAALGLGKLHGLIIEKKQVKGEHTHQHAHEHRSVSETDQWLEGVLGRNGKDKPPAKPVLQ